MPRRLFEPGPEEKDPKPRPPEGPFPSASQSYSGDLGFEGAPRPGSVERIPPNFDRSGTFDQFSVRGVTGSRSPFRNREEGFRGDASFAWSGPLWGSLDRDPTGGYVGNYELEHLDYALNDLVSSAVSLSNSEREAIVREMVRSARANPDMEPGNAPLVLGPLGDALGVHTYKQGVDVVVRSFIPGIVQAASIDRTNPMATISGALMRTWQAVTSFDPYAKNASLTGYVNASIYNGIREGRRDWAPQQDMMSLNPLEAAEEFADFDQGVAYNDFVTKAGYVAGGSKWYDNVLKFSRRESNPLQTGFFVNKSLFEVDENGQPSIAVQNFRTSKSYLSQEGFVPLTINQDTAQKLADVVRRLEQDKAAGIPIDKGTANILNKLKKWADNTIPADEGTQFTSLGKVDPINESEANLVEFTADVGFGRGGPSGPSSIYTPQTIDYIGRQMGLFETQRRSDVSGYFGAYGQGPAKAYSTRGTYNETYGVPFYGLAKGAQGPTTPYVPGRPTTALNLSPFAPGSARSVSPGEEQLWQWTLNAGQGDEVQQTPGTRREWEPKNETAAMDAARAEYSVTRLFDKVLSNPALNTPQALQERGLIQIMSNAETGVPWETLKRYNPVLAEIIQRDNPGYTSEQLRVTMAARLQADNEAVKRGYVSGLSFLNQVKEASNMGLDVVAHESYKKLPRMVREDVRRMIERGEDPVDVVEKAVAWAESASKNWRGPTANVSGPSGGYNDPFFESLSKVPPVAGPASAGAVARAVMPPEPDPLGGYYGEPRGDEGVYGPEDYGESEVGPVSTAKASSVMAAARIVQQSAMGVPQHAPGTRLPDGSFVSAPIAPKKLLTPLQKAMATLPQVVQDNLPFGQMLNEATDTSFNPTLIINEDDQILSRTGSGNMPWFQNLVSQGFSREQIEKGLRTIQAGKMPKGRIGEALINSAVGYLSDMTSAETGGVGLEIYDALNPSAPVSDAGKFAWQRPVPEGWNLVVDTGFSKKRKDGSPVYATVSHQNKTIIYNPNGIAQLYEDKAWTKPRIKGVAALPPDFFESPEEFALYVQDHELAHTAQGSELVGSDRENAANKIAESAMRRGGGGMPPVPPDDRDFSMEDPDDEPHDNRYRSRVFPNGARGSLGKKWSEVAKKLGVGTSRREAEEAMAWVLKNRPGYASEFIGQTETADPLLDEIVEQDPELFKRLASIYSDYWLAMNSKTHKGKAFTANVNDTALSRMGYHGEHESSATLRQSYPSGIGPDDLDPQRVEAYKKIQSYISRGMYQSAQREITDRIAEQAMHIEKVKRDYKEREEVLKQNKEGAIPVEMPEEIRESVMSGKNKVDPDRVGPDISKLVDLLTKAVENKLYVQSVNESAGSQEERMDRVRARMDKVNAYEARRAEFAGIPETGIDQRGLIDYTQTGGAEIITREGEMVSGRTGEILAATHEPGWLSKVISYGRKGGARYNTAMGRYSGVTKDYRHEDRTVGMEASEVSQANAGFEAQALTISKGLDLSGLSPKETVETIRNALNGAVRAYTDGLEEGAKHMDDAGKIAAKASAKRIGTHLNAVVDNMMSVVETMEGVPPKQSKQASGAIINATAKEIEALKEQYPDFARKIKGFGDTEEVMAGPRRVLDVGDDAGTQIAVGKLDGVKQRHGKWRDDGFDLQSIYRTPFGRIMMAQYMGGMAWQGTGGRVVQEAEQYEKLSFAGAELSQFGGGELGSAAESSLIRQQMAYDRSQVAYQMFGALGEAGRYVDPSLRRTGQELGNIAAVTAGVGALGYVGSYVASGLAGGTSLGASLLGSIGIGSEAGAAGAASAAAVPLAAVAGGTMLGAWLGNTIAGYSPDEAASMKSLMRMPLMTAIASQGAYRSIMAGGGGFGRAVFGAGVSGLLSNFNFTGAGQENMMAGLGGREKAIEIAESSVMGRFYDSAAIIGTSEQQDASNVAHDIGINLGMADQAVLSQAAGIQQATGFTMTPDNKRAYQALISDFKERGVSSAQAFSETSDIAWSADVAPGSQEYYGVQREYEAMDARDRRGARTRASQIRAAGGSFSQFGFDDSAQARLGNRLWGSPQGLSAGMTVAGLYRGMGMAPDRAAANTEAWLQNVSSYTPQQQALISQAYAGFASRGADVAAGTAMVDTALAAGMSTSMVGGLSRGDMWSMSELGAKMGIGSLQIKNLSSGRDAWETGGQSAWLQYMRTGLPGNEGTAGWTGLPGAAGMTQAQITAMSDTQIADLVFRPENQVYSQGAARDAFLKQGEFKDGLGGTRGLKEYYANEGYSLQLAALGVQGAGIAARKSYLWGADRGGTWNDPAAGSMWNLEDRQRAIQWQSQQAGFAYSFKSMDTREEFAQENEQASYSKWNLNNSFQRWNMGFSYQSSLMGRENTRNQWQFQSQMTEQNFGWNMEDMDEQIRRSSGRNRALLIRQRDRATLTHNEETSEVDRERKAEEAQWKRQDEQYKKQQQHIQQITRMEEEEFSRSKKQRQTLYNMDREDLERKLKESKELYEIQEAMVEQQRKYQADEIKRQEASLGIQYRQLKLAEEQKRNMEDMGYTVEDWKTAFQLLASYTPAIERAAKAVGNMGGLSVKVTGNKKVLFALESFYKNNTGNSGK